ncbi:conserved hypothetical protein [Desulfamplus magnetovallimortis]|uniref:Uncharacterized protein n=1 Tax=Desulfamplus magnetovallimortis TaxID=1246637 RepID=A0A1W1HDE8_9BACT|nr:hypothetical protein [Desulfamplus magnetovallimortis]SLM30422.1 conserved hypothetical protein [Desulfamplus magnetovallimortis]
MNEACPKFNKKNQAKLNAFIDPAVERFKALPEDASVDGQISQDDFKHTLVSFTRLYSFLSQIVPFYDIELEKLFPYIRFLLKKLPKKSIEERLKLDDEVALEYYRLNKAGDGDIVLETCSEWALSGATEAGVRRKKDEEKSPLSEIISTINDRFGTEFNETDRLFFDQIVQDCIADENLKIQALANTIDNFKFPFEDAFINKVIDRMDQNTDIFNRLMEGGDFSDLVAGVVLKEVYQRLTNIE